MALLQPAKPNRTLTADDILGAIYKEGVETSALTCSNSREQPNALCVSPEPDTQPGIDENGNSASHIRAE